MQTIFLYDFYITITYSTVKCNNIFVNQSVLYLPKEVLKQEGLVRRGDDRRHIFRTEGGGKGTLVGRKPG